MRKSLFDTFDELYIFNLHGNKRKKEPDENVFDVMVGVNIALFVKFKEPSDEKKVYYYSTLDNNILDRETKYGILLANDVSSLPWTELKPIEPHYWFVPKELDNQDEYKQSWKLTDIFKEYGSGVKTERDKINIHYTEKELLKVISDFINLDEKDIAHAYDTHDSRDWKISKAKDDLIKNYPIYGDKLINTILYRPFDFRKVYYTGTSRGFIGTPQKKIANNFIHGNNIGLVSVRQFIENKIFNHVLVSDKITDIRITTSNRGTGYLFPLFIYENGSERKVVNFNMKFIKFLLKTYGKPPIPPMIVFSYIYAILHSSLYRERYNEFLKTDFPRIPFTKDSQRFKILAKLGTNLIGTHLLKHDYSDSELALYLIEGDNRVDKIKYDEENFRLYINKEQYFENVPKEVWNMEIGGYQVIKKWLQYRKKDGIKLSYKDITHLKKVIRALDESISIIDHINQVYKKLDF
jgi:predicted helicase